MSASMAEGMAEVIRLELRKGSYQMPGDTLPYETQAAKIAEQLAANGYGYNPETWNSGYQTGWDDCLIDLETRGILGQNSDS